MSFVWIKSPPRVFAPSCDRIAYVVKPLVGKAASVPVGGDGSGQLDRQTYTKTMMRDQKHAKKIMGHVESLRGIPAD